MTIKAVTITVTVGFGFTAEKTWWGCKVSSKLRKQLPPLLCLGKQTTGLFKHSQFVTWGWVLTNVKNSRTNFRTTTSKTNSFSLSQKKFPLLYQVVLVIK